MTMKPEPGKEFESPISRMRLEEIATKLKDKLLEDDYEEGLIYLKEELELTRQEAEWFGIDYDIIQDDDEWFMD